MFWCCGGAWRICYACVLFIGYLYETKGLLTICKTECAVVDGMEEMRKGMLAWVAFTYMFSLVFIPMQL